MNATQAMLKGAALAAKERTNLLNMLCRKCRAKYFKMFSVKDKNKATANVDEAIKSKAYNTILCKICKMRLDHFAERLK